MDNTWSEGQIAEAVEKELGLRGGALTRIRMGFGADKWIVDTRMGRLLFKIVRGSAKLERVARTVNMAIKGGIATPPILSVGAMDAAAEVGFLIQEYWEGEDSGILLPSLSTTERSSFFCELGRELAKLHRVTGELDWANEVLLRLDVLVGRNRQAAVLSTKEIESAEVKIRSLLKASGDAVSGGLTHGDLYPPNLLSRHRRFCAFLDFDHAKLYDPVFDFVKLRMWTFGIPVDEIDFLSGYLDGGSSEITQFEERYELCLGLELWAGFPYWKAEGNERLMADYRARFCTWL